VATPHSFHHAHALLAVDAGKHVLVEKPIALNAVHAEEIADRASAKGVFSAEALRTFFLSRYDVIRQGRRRSAGRPAYGSRRQRRVAAPDDAPRLSP
jgi:predicted dehydrogenase